jgi:protein Mpv17
MLRYARDVAKKFPFAFGVGVAAAKTSAADYLAQTLVEGKKEVDWRRNGLFFVWGAGYLGGVQYFVYVHLFSRVLFPSAATFLAKPLRARFADKEGMVVVLKQLGIDQFLHHPFVVFPTFYCVKEFIEQGSLTQETVPVALQKYRNNFFQDCQICWQVWIPANFINFAVCPPWMRVPFVAGVSFGFTTYFSFLRGAPQSSEP